MLNLYKVCDRAMFVGLIKINTTIILILAKAISPITHIYILKLEIAGKVLKLPAIVGSRLLFRTLR